MILLKCPKCGQVHTETTKVFKCPFCGKMILPYRNAKVFVGELIDWEKELLIEDNE